MNRTYQKNIEKQQQQQKPSRIQGMGTSGSGPQGVNNSINNTMPSERSPPRASLPKSLAT